MRNDLTPLVLGLLVAACSGRDTSTRPGAGGGEPAADTTAAAPGAGRLLAYVTNEGSEELTIIDTRTDSAVATIPVGTRPRGVRVSRDGKTIFVALSGSPRCPPTMPDAECEKLKADKSKDGIAVVDAASRKVTRVLPGGSDPETFDISRDGATLFVSNEDAGTASIVDIASGKIRSTVPVGKEPEGVRVQPDGKAVWVTGETDHNVTIVDTETGKVLGQVEVGQRPRSLAFTPDGKRAYVTSEVDGTVWVLDAPAERSIEVLTMPEGSKTMAAVASPDGKRIYVSNGRGGTVSVIDRGDGSVVGTRAGGPAALGHRRSRRTAASSTRPTARRTTSASSTPSGSAVEKTVPVGKIPGASPWARRRDRLAGARAARVAGRRTARRRARRLRDRPRRPGRPACAVEHQPRRPGRAGRLPGERHRDDTLRITRVLAAHRRCRFGGSVRAGLARHLRPARMAGHRAHPHRTGRGPRPATASSRAPTAASC